MGYALADQIIGRVDGETSSRTQPDDILGVDDLSGEQRSRCVEGAARGNYGVPLRGHDSLPTVAEQNLRLSDPLNKHRELIRRRRESMITEGRTIMTVCEVLLDHPGSGCDRHDSCVSPERVIGVSDWSPERGE